MSRLIQDRIHHIITSHFESIHFAENSPQREREREIREIEREIIIRYTKFYTYVWAERLLATVRFGLHCKVALFF